MRYPTDTGIYRNRYLITPYVYILDLEICSLTFQPASACYCEAPAWKYYGEVDAQNKFQGRSFEIRPTGVAHAELIIPKKWVKGGLNYPAAGPEYEADHVVEHYS
jgi:hypothetical protein